jgi:predicted nucleotidyltransferase
MDHARPIPSLIPGARGVVLDVLTRVQRGMTIRQLADRAGVSHPQAARHVADLERLGIVRREHVGRSHVITLTDTLTVDLLRRMTELRQAVLRAMTDTASLLEPRPVSMVVFGSFARGDDDAESDIDVLVVVKDDKDDGVLDAALARWCQDVTRLTGNPVTEIVVPLAELDSMDRSLRESIERDGITILPEMDARGPRLKVVAEERSPYGP